VYARKYYAAMRTYNLKGLTIPSQIRYVDYYSSILDIEDGQKPVVDIDPPALLLVSLTMTPAPFVEK